MGNSFGCFSTSNQRIRSSNNPPSPCLSRSSTCQRSRRVFSTSSEKMVTLDEVDDDSIRQQAILAAALLYQHHHQNGTLPPQFDRSTSLKCLPPSSSKKRKNMNMIPRSASARPHSLSDSLLPSDLQLSSTTDHQNVELQGLDTKHFVLVHGGGFGAWCWYKTMTLLQEAGYEVHAVDLSGSGIHSHDTNSISSLVQYVKPLTHFLENLAHGKKVILVGHDIGGACISYVMEMFPSKVSKAIFVAAAMLADGQRLLDIFTQQMGLNDPTRHAQTFVYANGKNQPPTAIEFDKSSLSDILFNHTPAKDVALASVSMRPIPFAPVTEKLSLSAEKYGSISRFYIKTLDDLTIPLTLQEAMINANPPQQVFQLKGSDHAPFFSRPQALHNVLVQISKISTKRM